MRRKVVALVTLLPLFLVREPLVFADTLIIPSLSVSGTYDSNVFYTPKSALPVGTKVEDYYATVTPQLAAAYRGANVNGSLSVGANITRYKDNPELDYTGINASGIVDMKQWANRLSPRIEGLTVTGTYQFTPSVSSFGALSGGAVGGSYGVTGVTTPLNAGLITNRVSIRNYSGAITGGYRLTPVTTMTGSYGYTQISFGNQSGGVNNALFDTIGHTGTVALNTQLSQRDSVGTTATLSHYIQEGASSSESAAGASSALTTVQGLGVWRRQWTRELTASLGAGALLSLPVDTPGGRIKASATPVATAMVSYSSYSEGLKAAGASLSSLSSIESSSLGPFAGLPPVAGSLRPGGILPPGRYTARLSYNLGVYPSYAIGSGPLTAHVMGVNVNGGIIQNLTGQVGMNYSHGSLSDSQLTGRSSYDTIGATVGLSYIIASRFLASVAYDWLYFASSTARPALARQDEIAFSKKMVTLSLSYVFSSQPFFRAGGLSGFGKAGSSDPLESSPGGTPDLKKVN